MPLYQSLYDFSARNGIFRIRRHVHPGSDSERSHTLGTRYTLTTQTLHRELARVMVAVERKGDLQASKKEHANELQFTLHVDLKAPEERKGQTQCQKIGNYIQR